MPRPIENLGEHEEQRRNILARQRALLQHLPAWLKHKGLKQRELAERMNVSEAAVSKWISGTDTLSLGRLAEIAAILSLQPADLIGAPPGDRLGQPVAELMTAAEGLSGEELAQLAGMARLIRRKSAP